MNMSKDNIIRILRGAILYRKEDGYNFPLAISDTRERSDVRSIVLTVRSSAEFVENFVKARNAGAESYLAYFLPQAGEHKSPVVAMSKVDDTHIVLWVRGKIIEEPAFDHLGPTV